MTDYIALSRSENFQSLFEKDGACRKTMDHLERCLQTQQLSPYEQGKMQGQLYALKQLPELVRQLSEKQQKEAVEADRERAAPEPWKRFLRSVP